jgi:hypothetical protein
MAIVIHEYEAKKLSEELLMKYYAQAITACEHYVSSGLTYTGAWKNNVTVLEREIARRRVAADKPVCTLTGEDGNVFAIISKVSRTLNNAGQPALSKEFREKCFKSPSYSYVLNLCSEYVEVI